MSADESFDPQTNPDGFTATATFTSRCFGCGRQAKVVDGKERWHGCRWRLLSRYGWRRYLQGWHSAHRFAVENRDDPMVLADAHDYGSGWAGFMRQDGGAVELLVGDDDER